MIPPQPPVRGCNRELASNTSGLGRRTAALPFVRACVCVAASILAALLQPAPLSQPDLHSINCQRGDFYIKCNASNKLPCTQEKKNSKPLPRIYHLSTVLSEYEIQ